MPAAADHFSERADLYARFRPRYPSEVDDAIRSLAPRRRLVWEAACGSGQLTRRLAGSFNRVVAGDLSLDQLQRAPRIRGVVYVREAAEASALASGSADAAVSGQSAHWLDLPRFYAEVRRIVRPGGLVGLVTYGTPAATGSVDGLIQAFHRKTLAAHWPAARVHVDQRYVDLPFPFRRLTVPDIDMVEDWTASDFLGYAASWSGVRNLLRAGGAGVFQSFGEELRAAWGDGLRTVRWPITLLAGLV